MSMTSIPPSPHGVQGPSGMPGSSGHPGPSDAYSYDVERRDASAPGSLGEPGGAPRPRRRRWVSRLYWGILILSLAITAALVWFLVIRPMGVGTSMVAFTAALVPVGIVLSALWWLDRYTPQPRVTLIYSFIWGAAGSVGLTFLLGGPFTAWISPEGEVDETVASFLGAVIQAPVIEEGMKSLGLVFLLLWGRRFIRGPLDGVVYAALIAAGFAFTENILYFGRSFHDYQAAGDIAVFWQTFLLRGLLSPFAHASFTALCGLGLGIAAERRSLMLYFGLGVGGLSLGMVLHAVWNGSTFFLPVDPEAPMAGFLRYYLTIQVPIFVLLAGIILFLRLRERRILRRQLSEYGRAGWFSTDEVALLISMRERRRAERWASRHGALARVAMHDLILSAVSLGMERHGVLHGRPTERTRARERQLLERITQDRRQIGALTAPVVREAGTEGAAQPV